MNDRSAALDAAVRAQGELIAEAQRLLTAYVETKRVHPDAVINDLLWLLDGPRQREAERLVREALDDDPGRSPDVSDWFVFSRDVHGRDAKSRALPSEDAALTH